MSQGPASAAPLPRSARATQRLRILLAAMLALVAITAIQFEAPNALVRTPAAVDYHVFVEVGRLARDGQVTRAYDAAAFRAHQAAQPGAGAFMPWTYPPQFNLLAWLLSAMPVGLGYATFVLGGALGLWLVLRRLAPRGAVPALLLVVPAAILTIRSGQNGFLTAVLGGLVCLFLLRASPVRAGAGLALLAYKPHLGLGLALVALLRGGPATVLAGAATLAAVLAATTAILGPGVWPAFWTSLGDSGRLLGGGGYQLESMTSLFAFLRRLGLPASPAMAAQAALALGLMTAVGWAALRGWTMRHVLAFGGLTGLAMSPYVYAYDLVAAAPALALALPAAHRVAAPWEKGLLIGAVLSASGWALAMAVLKVPLDAAAVSPPSLGGPAYLLALALVFRLLARAETAPAPGADHPTA